MQNHNDQPQSNWKFHDEGGTTTTAQTPTEQAPTQAAGIEQTTSQQAEQPPQTHEPAQESVSWSASEFIERHKNAGWYFSVVMGFVALCALIYVLTKDLISVITIAAVVVLFLIISAKKPKQRSYSVDSQGITIDGKFYPYGNFKSFAVAHEGMIGYITFMPLQRFMPELSIYYAPEDEDKIISTLINNLPNEQRNERPVDRLMKHLRF